MSRGISKRKVEGIWAVVKGERILRKAFEKAPKWFEEFSDWRDGLTQLIA